MKFLRSISLFCFIAMFILGGVYWCSKNSIQKEGTEHKINSSSNEKSEHPESQDLTVSTKQNVTTCDTIYEVETHIGEFCSVSTEELPFSFSGLNREELIAEIARYEQSPSFADKQKGFQTIELLQFHPEKIIVKKVYVQKTEKIIYYLKAVDHQLIVFRSDMEDPYMPTELTLDMLPENVQQEIIAIKCFNDIRDVYSFLESYTS